MARILLLGGMLMAVLGLTTGAQAAAPCWQRVLDDWIPDARVDRSYSIGCYRDAIGKLPEDLRTYSSAPDDIGRALHAQLAERSPRGAKARPAPADAGGGGGIGRLLVLLTSVTVVAVLAVAARR